MDQIAFDFVKLSSVEDSNCFSRPRSAVLSHSISVHACFSIYGLVHVQLTSSRSLQRIEFSAIPSRWLFYAVSICNLPLPTIASRVPCMLILDILAISTAHHLEHIIILNVERPRSCKSIWRASHGMSLGGCWRTLARSAHGQRWRWFRRTQPCRNSSASIHLLGATLLLVVKEQWYWRLASQSYWICDLFALALLDSLATVPLTDGVGVHHSGH